MTRPTSDAPPGRRTIPTPLGAPGRMDGMVSGVRAGGFLFFSALRGRRPDTEEMTDDPEEQARQLFDNLQVLLEGAGVTLRHVVKVTAFLGDLRHRRQLHQVWMEYFPVDPPARLVVQVADANAAPGGNAHFVLDVIALAD